MEEALGQLLFVVERHHLPVGTVNVVERGLAAHLGGVGSHLLLQVGHFVHGHDAAAHEQRLCEQDGARPGVARVGIEGIDDALSHGVQRARDLADALSGQLADGFGREAHLLQGHERLLGQLREGAAHALLQRAAHGGAQLRQRGLLLAAEQADGLAGVLIGAQCTEVGQVHGAC